MEHVITASHTLWWYGGVVSATVVQAVYNWRKRNRKPRPRWHVVTEPSGNSDEIRYHRTAVSVWVMPTSWSSTREGFHVGSADPGDANYEDEIARLQSEAEDRVHKLVATGVR